MLQRGRAHVSAETDRPNSCTIPLMMASMGPRSRERGNSFSGMNSRDIALDGLQRGRAHVSAETFRYSLADGLTDTQLQRGRAHVSAETPPSHVTIRQARLSSFNGAALT